MSGTQDSPKFFNCPSCQESALSQTKHGWNCPACSTKFPVLDGLNWLFSNPNSALAEWKNQISFYINQLESEANNLAETRSNTETSDLTSDRLSRIEQGKRAQIEKIEDILHSIITRNSAPPEFHEALKNKLPLNQNILSYYDNIFRDWSWGEDENQTSISSIIDLIEEKDISWDNVLILGSGASRLAYDLIEKFEPIKVTLFDINPLLLFIAKDLFNGNTVKINEFPLVPKTIEDSVIYHELKAPRSLADSETEINFVLGELSNLPFNTKEFSLIITPWLMDIVPYSPKSSTQLINQLVQKSGNWIFLGSTAFSFSDESKCLSREEYFQIIEESQFKIEKYLQADQAYMKSPHSCHSRMESTLYFLANKIKDSDSPQVISYIPEWIIDPSKMIPCPPEIQSLVQKHAIPQFVLSKIDGKTSISEIARALEASYGLSHEEAIRTLQNFLTSIFEQELVFRKN